MKQLIIEQLAFSRQLELQNDKTLIKQTFDNHHLKSIHAYLFQDSASERLAGQFRPPVNDVHSKNRPIYPIKKPFFYHPRPSEQAVDDIISQAVGKLSSAHTFEQKTQILSWLYAELDYQHPFIEGNSRTIRLFISDIARRYGIRLSWHEAAKDKDEFYRARDYEIASRNLMTKPDDDLMAYMLDEAQRYQSKDYIAMQIRKHHGRHLTQIIQDGCQPIKDDK